MIRSASFTNMTVSSIGRVFKSSPVGANVNSFIGKVALSSSQILTKSASFHSSPTVVKKPLQVSLLQISRDLNCISSHFNLFKYEKITHNDYKFWQTSSILNTNLKVVQLGSGGVSMGRWRCPESKQNCHCPCFSQHKFKQSCANLSNQFGHEEVSHQGLMKLEVSLLTS